ncbi:hypothetical protein TI05_08345 [Achromatium sp. WMS3]|nr:hypothetical protein TI05_08345 [Achromatium sp. WMS3]
MGQRHKNGRNITGILLLNKPIGITSNTILQQVKRLYKAQKVGHTGSLDPLATGMLPLCFGEATKISTYLLDADKHYQVRVRLGITTTTADMEGDIVETAPWQHISKIQIRNLLKNFEGEIEQLPPMYSAVKHKGERLYNLARQGIEVERTPRRITIYSVKLLEWEPPEFDLDLRCSKGTYVRTLAEDLGKLAGCGAHVNALHRVGVGPYQEANMVSTEAIEAAARTSLEALDALLLPIETALEHWPELRVSEASAFYLKQGQAVLIPKTPTQGLVRLFTKSGIFLGIGNITDDGKVQPKRILGKR